MNGNKSKKFPTKILGMVTVNEKGQIVIPSEARAAINIHSGDKLLVMVHPSHEGITLIKPEGLEQYATQMLQQLNVAKDAFK